MTIGCLFSLCVCVCVCVFLQIFVVVDFLSHSIVDEKDAWYDFTFLKFIENIFVAYYVAY